MLEDRKRMYYEECLGALRLGDSKKIGKAHERLRELRASGVEPMASPEVQTRIGSSNGVRQRAILEWEALKGRNWDPEEFSREILPGLQNVTITRMATTSDLSIQYCSRIRSGQNVPHPMHWSALRALVD